MASAPPNTGENRETDRNEALTALALLLASVKRRYDLPALIRANGIKPRRLRQIRPTKALASGMAAPHFMIVRAWEAVLPDIIAAIPFGRAAVADAIDNAARNIGLTVTQAKAIIPSAVEAIERWHRTAWISRIKAASGLDVSMFTQASDVADPVQATVTWQGALADDVHHSIKAKLTAVLLVAGITASDAKARAADVIAKARRRAVNIGLDQADKASEGMTHARMEAAGLTQWLWQHNTEIHYRPEHKARNGNIYTDETAPADLPGTLPFCRCVAIPILQ